MAAKAVREDLELFSALCIKADDSLTNLGDEKSFESFVENQRNIYDLTRKKKVKPKSVFSDSDSDEELKLKLKNAVKLYRRNKKETPAQIGSTLKTETAKSNYDEIKTTENLNTTQYRSITSVEKAKSCVNNEIEGNKSASSDIQQIINFFFLEKSDPARTESKKYWDYEKQGAIPKSKFRGQSDENAFSGIRKNEQSKQLGKTRDNKSAQYLEVNSHHNYASCKSRGTIFSKSPSGQNSNEKIVRLSERICSQPFFYIVPENPRPNFLLPRGSYYIIPKQPDTSSCEEVIFHPETASKFRMNANWEFEINNEQDHFPKDRENRNPNDLGREVLRKMDSHLNIGPGDVKEKESLENLETNCEPCKIYDKSLVRSSSGASSFAAPREKDNTSEEEMEAPQDEPGILDNAQLYDSEEEFEVQQVLELSVPEVDAAPAANSANNYHVKDSRVSDGIASGRLEKKNEEQLLRLLSALPESSIEELIDVYNQMEGDEIQVSRYIDKAKSDAKKRQNMLEMLTIFPDADPDYLSSEMEKLGGNEHAINMLTGQMLDDNTYPKITDYQMNAERQRLWKKYVENFNVEHYIRNVPSPENLKDEEKGEIYQDLALNFLKSRYPDLPLDFLQDEFASNGSSVIRTCTSSLLSNSFVRLADSSFKYKNFTEAFLKEICYVENKEEIDRYKAELKEQKALEIEDARLNDTFLICPLCYNDEVVTSEAITCPDGHLFCKDCVKRYVFVKLGDGLYKFPCPSDACETFFSHATLENLLPDSILSNISKKQQAAEINSAKVDGLESCPYCEYAYIPNPEDKIFKCQNLACLIETCRKCQQKSHIPLRCEEVERPRDREARKKIEETMTEKLIRICPTCFKKFIKQDGCNKMTCTCGTIMCYYCRRKIQDYSHFQRTTSETNKCPLYSRNEELHVDDVIQAGRAVREEIFRENPDVQLVTDPTVG